MAADDVFTPLDLITNESDAWMIRVKVLLLWKQSYKHTPNQIASMETILMDQQVKVSGFVIRVKTDLLLGLKFGWKIVVGSFIGFCGATFGSVGGVGGGGIFVPMLTLIIGFDTKSATAISKCMIMGAAASTVYYNLIPRHPTLDMPIIDYHLAVLIQPMLMLGVSIGVAFNVIFADWRVTALLIILFIGTSSKAFCRGIETWNKETILKQEAAKQLEPIGDRAETGYKLLPGGPSNINDTEAEKTLKEDVTVLENVCWKEFGLLAFVWVAFLALQIAKTYTSTCSVLYWVLNLLQVPVSIGVSGYEAFSLYKGSRMISS